jgi:hypothetical protein
MNIRAITKTSYSIKWSSGYCTDIDLFRRIYGGIQFELAIWNWFKDFSVAVGPFVLIAWNTYNPDDCTFLDGDSK